MARKPRQKETIPRTTKKSPMRKQATQETHFLRVMRQAQKIRGMREELKDLHGEALRAYLMREFGAGKQGEQFRRFSAADLSHFRQMLIDGCTQWLRDAGKGMK